MAGVMSAISSRNNVPPRARSIWPSLGAVAPVNEFFSWPKSSLSSNCSGKELQWSVTNGPSRCALLEWITRAASVLPVPVGPVINTGAREAQACAISIKQRCIPAEAPTSRAGAAWSSRGGGVGGAEAESSNCFIALSNSIRSSGFTR